MHEQKHMKVMTIKCLCHDKFEKRNLKIGDRNKTMYNLPNPVRTNRVTDKILGKHTRW